MSKDLDEGVLDGLVRIGAVPQILVGDAQGATLMRGDQPAEAFTRFICMAAFHELADLDGEPGVVRQLFRRGPTFGQLRGDRRRTRRGGVPDRPRITHKVITMRPDWLLTVYRRIGPY